MCFSYEVSCGGPIEALDADEEGDGAAGDPGPPVAPPAAGPPLVVQLEAPIRQSPLQHGLQLVVIVRVDDAVHTPLHQVHLCETFQTVEIEQFENIQVQENFSVEDQPSRLKTGPRGRGEYMLDGGWDWGIPMWYGRLDPRGLHVVGEEARAKGLEFCFFTLLFKR